MCIDMVNRFCFVCGKQTDKLKDGYCEECFPEKKRKERKKKVYSICYKCGYVKLGREWKKRVPFGIKTKKTVCPVCSRKHGDYYEAILQIRGEFSDRHIDFIERNLHVLEKKDRMAFYFPKKVKGGYDIRVGSKKAATSIAKLLKEKFGCELKRSYKLYSRKAGRDVTRNTILCRF